MQVNMSSPEFIEQEMTCTPKNTSTSKDESMSSKRKAAGNPLKTNKNKKVPCKGDIRDIRGFMRKESSDVNTTLNFASMAGEDQSQGIITPFKFNPFVHERTKLSQAVGGHQILTAGELQSDTGDNAAEALIGAANLNQQEPEFTVSHLTDRLASEGDTAPFKRVCRKLFPPQPMLEQDNTDTRDTNEQVQSLADSMSMEEVVQLLRGITVTVAEIKQDMQSMREDYKRRDEEVSDMGEALDTIEEATEDHGKFVNEYRWKVEVLTRQVIRQNLLIEELQRKEESREMNETKFCFTIDNLDKEKHEDCKKK